MSFLKKLKIDYQIIRQLYFWVNIQGDENRISGNTAEPHVYCNVTHKSRDMETTKVLIKEWMAYDADRYSSVMRRKESLPFMTTRMDLDGIKQSDMSNSERQIPYNLTSKGI